MKKSFFKLCSTILVLALLTNMLPMSIFAEEFKEQLIMQDSATLEKIVSEEAYVVAEVAEKRTEYTKEFLLSNGLHMATVYADPIHYEKDGQWAEIDNTLVAKSDGTWRNTAGAWNVSFPNQLSRSNSISIEKDGYTVSFSMAGELRSSGELMTAALGIEMTEQMAVMQMDTATATVLSIDAATIEAGYDYPEAAPRKLGSQLRYNNVYTNTDVVYDLQSDMVKESIIMDTYSSTLRGYRYTLNVGQLIPVLNEYGEITFYAPDSKTAVMIMPAPYLLDANEAYNEDIQVQLTGNGDTYTLTYLLPQQWLREEERAWPVILDPVIKASRDKLGMQDRTVAQKKTFSATKTTLDAGYSAERGKHRAYFKYLELPPLTSSDVVVSAAFRLTKIQTNSVSKTVEVHKVTSDWDHNTITWDTQPSFESDISDFAHIKEEGVYYWQVTEIVRSWYTEANYGLMIKMSNDVENGTTDYFRQFYSSDTGMYNRPTLQVIFKNNNGLEGTWDYTSTSAGRAGTGHVNNFTGNLVWVRSDMGFDGNRMPVSISHVYNANDAIVHEDLEGEVNNANDSGGNFFGLGVGWRTNYHERVFKWVCDDVTGADNYYIWEDGDGTDHYFKKSSGSTYKDEDGMELTLKTDLEEPLKFSIKDKNGNARYFDVDGRLVKIENKQKEKSSIDIAYVSGTDYEIDYITDGAGRKYDFVYTNGLLSSIVYRGHIANGNFSEIRFEYENFQLTKIIDNVCDDPICESCTNEETNKETIYTYNDDGILKSVADIDGYIVSYEYTRNDVIQPAVQEDQTDTTETQNYTPWEPPYLVSSITTEHNGKLGGSLSFTYGYNETRLKDHTGNTQIMQFNDLGNTVSIMDDEGHAQSAKYAANSHSDTGKANQLTLSSKMQNTVVNLLNHSSFEAGNPWTATSGSTGTVKTTEKHFGKKSLFVTGRVEAPTFTIPAKATYTLSVYVKAVGTATIGFNVSGEDVISTSIPVGTEFIRYQVSYTNNTENDVQATPFLTAAQSNGAYFDGVQLENMPTASRYNLVENGDFRFTGTDGVWTKYTNCTANDTYVTPTDFDPAAPQLDGNYYSITGNRTKTKNIKQVVNVSGAKGDSYVLAGWVAGYAVPQGTYFGDNRKFALRARFEYTDGSSSDYFYANFLPTIHGWQYSSAAMVAKKSFSQITVVLVYNYNVNTIYIDGIQLFEEEFGTSYTYDENGNVISVVDLQKKNTTYEYANNDLTKILEDGKAKVTYTYDDYHNVKTAKTEEGLTYGFEYDDFGNNKLVTIGTDDTKISSSATYTADGNYKKTTTDALGKVTTYEYDTNKGVLNWVKYPEDTEATKTQYTYDSMFRMSETVCSPSTGADMSAKYTYTDDYLTAVKTPTTTYYYGYGDFGLRTTVKAGDKLLATYVYDQEIRDKKDDDRLNDLDKLIYGNGDFIQYDYDNKGRTDTETYEDGDTVKYLYDNSGNLAKKIDYVDGQVKLTTTYFYDLLDRMVKYEEQGTGYSHSVTYKYDKNNNLSELVEVTNNVTVTTTYTYDDDNRIETVTTGDSVVRYSYDKYGRLQQKLTEHNGSEYKKENYTYTEPTSTSTSGQLAKHTIQCGSTSITYNYTYDGNGNIKTISDGNSITTYTYDKANQLISEDYQDTEEPTNSYTHTWVYDNAGNILNRTEYTATSSEAHTVEYTYPEVPEEEDTAANPETPENADATENPEESEGEDGTGNPEETKKEVWGDKLSTYDGKAIVYDNIGNPLSIGATENSNGRQFTWEHGRQLSTLTEGNTEWHYEYNADGIRSKATELTKNGENITSTKTYEYTYNGSQLTQMKVGSNTYRFSYDASGTPLTITLGNEIYYYITNMQGDVVGLMDTTGAQVVSYTYDAWGVGLTITGTKAATIGAENPLRYRSYVYDENTGLYYLQSRYYDPAMGRFINADNYPSTGQGLTGNNMFAYCGNNPVSRQDNGGELWNILGGALVGAVIGVASQAICNLIENKPVTDGLGKAALTGALGGALTAAFPGASTLINVGMSVAESVITDVQRGENVQTIVTNAALSAGFAAATSGGTVFGDKKIVSKTFKALGKILPGNHPGVKKTATTFLRKTGKAIVKEFGAGIADGVFVNYVHEGTKFISGFYTGSQSSCEFINNQRCMTN